MTVAPVFLEITLFRSTKKCPLLFLARGPPFCKTVTGERLGNICLLFSPSQFGIFFKGRLYQNKAFWRTLLF